ncbi:sodium-coupled neutral amino acid transporter 9 homolog isoform X4 [Pocillopora damicornis]|uniref:sodium-coupled neutral amino acid transporter 9 homolog isoform X4 n=1 Tax=Pocillopora damicornis TaxID=46731 RepID=UPI000F54D5DF|nr:sodium-coupled neutral amino acid transporter 9 homolog isoform X4 [Pocillopora damicornis]
MEGERSEYTRDKVVDEKSPLLSEQGDSSNAVKDRSRASNSSRGLYDSNSTHDGSLNSESSNNFAKRKPFHYNTLRNPVVTPHDMDIAAKFNRYRYISRLSRHNVIIPRHILPPHLFLVIPKESDEKQSSLVTIFSIWNTMMGTSLLSIPWAIDQAGFALAIILLVVMAGLCLYSCYLIIRCAEETETVHHAYSVPTSRNITNGSFSPGHLEVLCPGGHSASASSANRLITADKTSFFKFWQLQHTVPLFLIAILFPLCSVKSPTFFTKFNSLGTLSVVYIVVFIITKASIWGIHMDFKHDSIPMFKASFPALTGILTLAYFIHNCILSIMRNQENPKNNARDLSIAYFLVALTYIVVGLLFFISFPREKSCIQEVLLDNLPAPDIMTFIARLFLLFQLTTVFPLIVYIIRVQLMLYFFNKIYPSFLHIFVLNLALIGACVLFAVVYPHVGNIIRYVGSLSGLAYNYSLPCIVHMLIQKQKGQLSWPSTVFHSCIVVFGVLNFLSQFFING